MNFLGILETVIGTISNTVWPFFLPFMLIVGAYTAINAIFKVKKVSSLPCKLHPKNIIGPASISLGNMIGTGAIIGVMGSLSKLVGSGQANFEAMAIWALIGACIMVPVSYSEVLCSKIMQKTPKEYIAFLLSPKLAFVYMVSFAALYIFGFGGFQFSGIDTVVTIVTEMYLDIKLSQVQRYLFIIIPMIAFVSGIVLTKKHEIFINSMTYMIGTAVVMYFIFFITFVIKTNAYIPTFVGHMIEGLTNPVSAMIGMPTGFILGMQRVLQTAETGLGSLSMAAQEADSKPREAAAIALIPSIITICVSSVITSYICSYGVRNGIITLPAGSLERLSGYFNTAQAVTGKFGLFVLCAFTLLSALTTLLGSYFFLSKLFKNSENTNIAIYMAIILTSGTLAVFGFNIVFDAVDLLLFVVCGIHVVSLSVFVTKNYKDYAIDKK